MNRKNRYGGSRSTFHILLPITVVMLLTDCKSHSEKPFVREKNEGSVKIHNAGDSVSRSEFHRVFMNKFQRSYTINYKLTFDGKSDISLEQIVPIEEIEKFIVEGWKLREDTCWDSQLVRHEDVAESIDLSFRAYDQFDWARQYSLNDFINYSACVKINDETFTTWRTYYSDLFWPYIRDIPHPGRDTLRSLLIYLQTEGAPNDDVFYSWIKQNGKQVNLFNRSGLLNFKNPTNTEDFFSYLNISCYKMRSVGIPTTYEFTLASGKNDGPIAYLVYLNHQGKFFKDNTDEQLANASMKTAKVFRRLSNFDTSKSLNPFAYIKSLKIANLSIPISLHLPSCVDVTAERTNTTDITIPIDDSVTADRIMYISVWDKGKWSIVYYGEVDAIKKNITFRNMGTDILYQIWRPHGRSLIEYSSPFVCDSIGKMKIIETKLTNRIPLKLTNFSYQQKIDAFEYYTLLYWDDKTNDWKRLQTRKSGQFDIVFEDVPGNLLLQLEKSITHLMSRPFIINGETQMFY